MEMIKVSARAGQVKKVAGTSNVWDEKGRFKIAKIFMSHGTHLIQSIQFLFVDDNGHFVLSENHGPEHGYNFITVVLDYPSEFITGIRGTYYSNYNGLRSIIFYTNKGTHGPYGRNVESEVCNVFNLPIGKDCSFAGFYGIHNGTLIEDIGMYVKPTTSSMIESGDASIKTREKNGTYKRCKVIDKQLWDD
ncbi:inactive protein RESTRICTED TEV MOVEMENT 1-like [Capsicum galapagoense]